MNDEEDILNIFKLIISPVLIFGGIFLLINEKTLDVTVDRILNMSFYTKEAFAKNAILSY